MFSSNSQSSWAESVNTIAPILPIWAQKRQECCQQYLPDSNEQHYHEMSELVDGGETYPARPALLITIPPSPSSPSYRHEETTPVDRKSFPSPWDEDRDINKHPMFSLFEHSPVPAPAPAVFGTPSTDRTAVDSDTFSPLLCDTSSTQIPLFQPTATFPRPTTINGLATLILPKAETVTVIPSQSFTPPPPEEHSPAKPSDEEGSSTSPEPEAKDNDPPPQSSSNEDVPPTTTQETPNSGSPESEAPSNGAGQVTSPPNNKRRKPTEDEDYAGDEDEDDDYQPQPQKRRRGVTSPDRASVEDLKCQWFDNEQPCSRSFKKKYELERHVFEQHSVVEAKRVADDPSVVRGALHYAVDVIKTILTPKSSHRGDIELIAEAKRAFQVDKKWYDDGSPNVPVILDGCDRLIKLLQDGASMHRIFKCNRCQTIFSAERSLQRHMGHQNCGSAPRR